MKGNSVLTKDNIEQALIFSVSVVGAYMSTTPELTNYYPPYILLVAQPLWISMSLRKRQWGVFCLSLFSSSVGLRELFNTGSKTT